MMATTQPPPLRPPTQQQLQLPLSPPEPGRLIPPQQVWKTLGPEQQARLLRQLVSLCCGLLTATYPQEGEDEQR
jgi:hypothetical protein